MDFFDFPFWQSFVSNLFSTIIGVALGIPVALYVNSLLERSSEKDRKRKILILLRAELQNNLDLINQWLASPDMKESVDIVGYDLNSEVWDAFSDGGEIQWIRDPELLGKLANAYFSIKNLKEFGSWSDLATYYTPNPPPLAKDRSWNKLMGKPEKCIEQVSMAISSIDEALK